jgi:haloalkane dehalogenase
MIGFAWAVEHVARIRRLVVLNTAAFPLPATKKLPWQLKLARTPLGPLLVRGLNAFALGAAYTGVTRRPLPKAVRDGLVYPYTSYADRRAVLRFVQDIPLVEGANGFDIVNTTAARLVAFADTPTYIGWGLRDFVFDHHFLAEWKRRLPKAKVVEFAEAGHYVLEDESEALVPAIATFVRAE